MTLPDIGPVPAGYPPFTEAESDAARVDQAEQWWQAVLERYPDAVRPDATFTAYLTDETRVETMRECYTAAGLAIEEGRDGPDGPVVSIGASATNEAEAIARYVCMTAHPSTPVPGLNEAELGWLYDYLTEFSVPCLAANGIESEPAPLREDFVANWPNQHWYVSVGMSADPEWDAALEEACPSANGTLSDIQAVHDARS